MNRLAKIVSLGVPFAAAALLHTAPADACGGCFVPPSANTIVSGHRMALSISKTRTVLWDQIQYTGNPEEFSWVLPIKPGARIQEATSEWFDALEASTQATVQAPPLNCNGGAFGCGSTALAVGAAAGEDSGGTGGGVNVVRTETVGPYESVTLSSTDANALTDWLDSHGYAIPDDIQPVIGSYVSEGFDFIALRLIPGNGVDLMKPVRVITEGATPVLPLRMVAAGTGAYTSVVLYVIGEGRWEAANFPNQLVPTAQLKWDGDANDSNYASLRQQTLDTLGGMGWLTTYSLQNAFFSQGEYDDEGYATGSIAYNYINTLLDEDGTNYDEVNPCYAALNGSLDGVVIDTCDPETNVCGGVQPGQIDARSFTCGELDDLSFALTGMHPNDVWVTRMEANLPRIAFASDLELRAAEAQATVKNFHVATQAENYECPAVPALGSSKRDKNGGSGNGTAVFVVALGALSALLAMRRSRFVRA